MVKFGIIGMGNMGCAHLDYFLSGQIHGGIVTAVADTDPARLEIARQRQGFSAVCYLSGVELIEKADVDAVIVAVPHYGHPELSIAALNKNIHVICEKPAGVYTKQVKEMNEAADKSKALFAVMFNQRTNCVYRKMREIILSGGIGEIKRINWLITSWYRSQSYYDSGSWRATWKGEGGGVLFNQCPHQLDLLQWVTGMMPKSVQAFCHFGKWHDIEVEDDVTAYLEYENGATGVFITSTGDTPGTNRFEVLGTGGKLVCETEKLSYYKNKQDEREFNKEYTGGFGEPGFEEISVETDGSSPQHIGIINNFINAIEDKEPLFVDGREGIKSVELMDSMLLSTWLDKKIKLPLDDELYLSELNKRIKNSKLKEVQSKVLDTKGTYK